MLQFITHESNGFSYLSGAETAINGGCRWIQLRMKDAPDGEINRVGEQLSKLCRAADATFILDDRVDLVDSLGADGVHLGKNDMPVAEAREILGDNKIIGATANSLDDALTAIRNGADYLGVGPFRYTTTKKNLSPVLGLDGLRKLMAEIRKVSDIPVVAIGGITSEDIPAIMTTGVTGVAISGAILNAENPDEYVRNLIKMIYG